jgi:hypothetical protein
MVVGANILGMVQLGMPIDLFWMGGIFFVSLFTITHFLKVNNEVIVLFKAWIWNLYNLCFTKIMNIEVCGTLTKPNLH